MFLIKEIRISLESFVSDLIIFFIFLFYFDCNICFISHVSSTLISSVELVELLLTFKGLITVIALVLDVFARKEKH